MSLLSFRHLQLPASMRLLLLSLLFVFSSCAAVNSFITKPSAVPTSDLDKSTLENQWIIPSSVPLEPAAGHLSELLGLFIPPRNAFPPASAAETAITIDVSGNVLLWDVKLSQARKLLEFGHRAGAAAFCPAGGLIGVVDGEAVDIWSVSGRRNVFRLDSLDTRLNDISFQPDCSSVLLAGTDGHVYRWKFLQKAGAKTLKEEKLAIERYIGHPAVVNTVQFHPTGDSFISGDTKGSLWAWATYDSGLFKGAYNQNLLVGRVYAEKASRVDAAESSKEPVVRLLISPSGKFVFVARHDGKIEKWAVRGFKKLSEVQAHQGLIYDIALNAEETVLASVGRDGRVAAWSLKGEEEDYRMLPGRNFSSLNEIRRLAFLNQYMLLAGEKTGRLLLIAME